MLATQFMMDWKRENDVRKAYKTTLKISLIVVYIQ